MQAQFVDLAAMHCVPPGLAGASSCAVVQSVGLYLKDELQDVKRKLLPTKVLLHCRICKPHSSSTFSSAIGQLQARISYLARCRGRPANSPTAHTCCETKLAGGWFVAGFVVWLTQLTA